MVPENENQKSGGRGKWPSMVIGLLLVAALIITITSAVYYCFVVVLADDLEGTATVKGTYYNSRDKRVEGVLVRVEGTEIWDMTDEKGRYELEQVPAGRQKIVFERGGYPTITITQLIIPEDQLERYDVETNRLDVPDNIVGGKLVDKPRYRFDLDEIPLEGSNLTGKLSAKGISLEDITVTVHNSTTKATVNAEGYFELHDLFPGILLLNVTHGEYTTHAAGFLKEGDNNITFWPVGDNIQPLPNKDDIDSGKAAPLTVSSVEDIDNWTHYTTKEEVFVNVRSDEMAMPDAILLLKPLAYNPINLTIVDTLYHSALESPVQNIREKPTLTVIDGHVYGLEVTAPGLTSRFHWNLTYNGTDTLEVTLTGELEPVAYSYSLLGFKIVIVFHIFMSIIIILSLGSAFRSTKFSRVMTGTIAVFISSASLPLAFLAMSLAHNWILGGLAFVLLLIKRKDFSK